MPHATTTPGPYVPPDFVMAHVLNPILQFIGSPTLTVTGRKSGRPITTPLAPFKLDGARYLVSGGGETHWVRNIRAARRGKLRISGKTQAIKAVELHGEERDRVVAGYRDLMGRRAGRYFKILPKLADHPVFRIDPIEQPIDA